MIDSKPDFVVAFHPDLAHSAGTGGCVKMAILAKIPVFWYRSEGQERPKRVREWQGVL